MADEKPRSKPLPKRERDRDYKHYPTFTVNKGYGKRIVERPPMLKPPPKDE